AMADPWPKRANLRAALESARISALLRAYDQAVRMIQDNSRRTCAPSYYSLVALSRRLAFVRVCTFSRDHAEHNEVPRGRYDLGARANTAKSVVDQVSEQVLAGEDPDGCAVTQHHQGTGGPQQRRAVTDRLAGTDRRQRATRSEEHTSELQSRFDLVCRLLLEKKKHKS